MTNEEIVRRYCQAVAARDDDAAEVLRHPDWACHWPQTGERVPSSDALRRIGEADAAGAGTTADAALIRPLARPMTITGAADAWTVEWTERAPDGLERFVVAILGLRGGRVERETIYWAPPLEAPSGRRAHVEVDHGSMREDDPLRDRVG